MFNDTLNECDLTDLGYFGHKLTWANNQADNDHIKERLNRFCASPNWINFFSKFTNKHLLRYTSDHNLIMLEFYTDSECSRHQYRQKPKRFEQLWAQDKESILIVKKAWFTHQGDSSMKLNYTLYQIHNWGRHKYGNIAHNIKQLQNYLETLKHVIPTTTTLLKIRQTEENLEDLLKQEELWWAQRAKVNWLQNGDIDTKYFHQKASIRKRKNTIYSIQDESGNKW